jgi:hypothetical protein
VEEIRQNYNSSTGLVYAFETKGRFPVFQILTEDQQVLSFYWIREFDGSARFFEGIKAYENKIVEIIWDDIELYALDSQKYVFYPEIILLEERKTLDKKEAKDRIKAYQKIAKASKKPKKKKTKRKKKKAVVPTSTRRNSF